MIKNIGKKTTTKNHKGNAHRLLIITNREPFNYTSKNGETSIAKTTGGLVSALEDCMEKYNGSWLSAFSKKANKDLLSKIAQHVKYPWARITYPQKLHYGFYNGFSNSVLWPLYHSLLGHVYKYNKEHFDDYSKVNQLFANAIIKKSIANDIIWIHDYQLSLVPNIIRHKNLKNVKIGFFLHTPFPSYDLFRTMPWAKQILQGMLGASLIGFHVNEYCQNFFNCVEEILHLRCDRKKGCIIQNNRQIHIRAIPISIDPQKIYKKIHNHTRNQTIATIKNKNISIIGVDRLDYTKGIPEKILAFKEFLNKYPQYIGKVSLTQIAAPSRTNIKEYKDLRNKIENLVGHVNGLFATHNWLPISYICRSVPQNELISLYEKAHIALITPLRDGMNLVAKEYIASHQKNPGVLILSELTGAAQQLTEATLVNPYDTQRVADAIFEAINMPMAEKIKKMNLLQTKIEHFDIDKWTSTFINECLYVD